MNLLKELKKEIFWKAFCLEIGFLVLFGLIGSFFVSKIYGVVKTMQELGLGLYGEEEITPDKVFQLKVTLEQIGTYLNQIILYFVLLGGIIFVLYLVIKSLEWNLIYNGKIKNYKKYFRRFFLFSLILVIILIPLAYLALINSREFLLNYLFEEVFLFFPLLKLILLILISIFVIYLIFDGYVYANSYKFLESVKKIFSFKKFKIFLFLILVFLVSGLIIRYGLVVSSSVYSVIVQGLLVSLIFVWYKFYLVENLKS